MLAPCRNGVGASQESDNEFTIVPFQFTVLYSSKDTNVIDSAKYALVLVNLVPVRYARLNGDCRIILDSAPFESLVLRADE
jgi:hypothetical protein